MAHLFPSLTAADQLNLQRDIDRLEPYCQGFHLDVMDFNFVPNLTWGAPTVNAIAKHTKRTLWIHLMVEKPAAFMGTLYLPHDSLLTFHIEKINENKDIISRIIEKKWLPGIAISPKTPLEKALPFLEPVNHVTLMSVEPGFAGQAFLPDVLGKLDQLVTYRKTKNLKFTIAMDGGINETNIADLAKRGVNLFGVASAIFGKADPVVAYKKLQALTQE